MTKKCILVQFSILATLVILISNGNIYLVIRMNVTI